MSDAVTIITQYGYIALFPLAIIEGPIITIIGGFFVSLHLFGLFPVYMIVVAGDIIGDMFFYLFGRFGGRPLLDRIGPKIGITEAHIAGVREHFTLHGQRTIVIAKLIQGIGAAGLVVAGSAKVPYTRYLMLCLSVTLIQAAVFLSIGFFFGHAYAIVERSLNVFAAVGLLFFGLTLVVFILQRLRIKRG